MTPPATIETLISVVSDPGSGSDTYVNQGSLAAHGAGPSAFGGSLLAQAISAATATVPNGYHVYSSQSTFLQPPNFEDKTVYKIERIFDGRAFCTRIVRASQAARHIYTAIVSFQNGEVPPGDVLQYDTPMPDLGGSHPDKDDLMDYRKFLTSLMAGKSKPKRWEITADDAPFEWRYHSFEQSTDEPSDLSIRKFARSPPMSTANPATHLAAIAFLTDEFSPVPALAANMGVIGKTMMSNVATVFSLTHNISFHSSQVRADEWLFLERKTSWGAGGRVHLSQKIWNTQTGKLVASVDHEALIRLGKPKM
ncbi:putative acyl- thioesterase ii protein [Paramyrothecium foliicola]|nr:putative acyl- thioesterase ii protein [Paramyrothecium foliicola]